MKPYVCIECNTIDHCEKCNSKTKECTKCDNEYMKIINGECASCTTIDNCLTYDDTQENSCEKCTDGYYVNGGVCTKCRDAIEGCATCSNSQTCTMCSDYYYKLEGEVKCTPCDGNCSEICKR